MIEMSRLNVNFDNLKSLLVEIEDKTYYLNNGVSFKALLRGIASQIPLLKKRFKLIASGGSTITMQLARTLFIPSNQNKYVRKLFEIWISLWLRSRFSKKEVLNLYIVSVRYDYGVMGLANAIKHFFGDVNKRTLTPEESFILVERLSNVTGTYRQERVDHLINQTSVNLNVNGIKSIYEALKQQRKIK